MLILYHVFFGLGYASVPWVYSAEVSSLGWRTRGAAAATSVNWLGGFVVVQFTKVGLENLQWRFFLSKFSFPSRHDTPWDDTVGDDTDKSQVFAILTFACTPVMYLFYPETANRTLEDMDQIFIQNPSAFVFKNKLATQSQRPQAFVEAEAARIARATDYSRDVSSGDVTGNEKTATPEESALEV